MRLLLDTHIYLWAVDDSSRLSLAARQQILGADAVYVSAATIWEAAIKVRVGKLQGDVDRLIVAIGESGFQELPVLARHAALVATLPDHHRDPIDRLLIAQAMDGPLRFLTSDSILQRYSSLVEVV